MDYTFQTPTPPELSVEIGSGRVEIMAGETNDRTLVTVTGKGAEETTVEQHGNTIAVLGPHSRHGFSFAFGSNRLTVRISAPTGSALSTKLGSADLTATGTLGTCTLRSGSGDNELEDARTLEITSGSGDLLASTVSGDASLRSGSGDVRIRTVAGDVSALTGSGDVILGSVGGRASAKSGSGDVRIDSSDQGGGITTASGDIQLDRLSGGRLDARTASGDISVGVTAGLPAWTDIHTMTGTVHSRLASLGRPSDGAPYVELRLRAVSGDVVVGHLEPHDTAGAPGPAHPEPNHPEPNHTEWNHTESNHTEPIHTDPTRTL